MVVEIFSEDSIRILIEEAVVGRYLDRNCKDALFNAFDWGTTPQNREYWYRKAEGKMRWAKKDTKYLSLLINVNHEEESIWL